MSIESSIYFYCDNLPDDSPLLKSGWLQKRERGGYISPSYKAPLKPDGKVNFHEWEKFLTHNRPLLLECESPRIDIGIMADCQMADFDLRVSPQVMQAFAAAKVWLGLTLMPNGNKQTRYQKNYYDTLSADRPSCAELQLLPPSIRRHQAEMGLYPIRVNSCLYEPDELPPDASTIAICQYLGEWGFASNDIPPVLMETLSSSDRELRLHINLPQRRGRRANCSLC